MAVTYDVIDDGAGAAKPPFWRVAHQPLHHTVQNRTLLDPFH